MAAALIHVIPVTNWRKSMVLIRTCLLRQPDEIFPGRPDKQKKCPPKDTSYGTRRCTVRYCTYEQHFADTDVVDRQQHTHPKENGRKRIYMSRVGSVTATAAANNNNNSNKKNNAKTPLSHINPQNQKYCNISSRKNKKRKRVSFDRFCISLSHSHTSVSYIIL